VRPVDAALAAAILLGALAVFHGVLAMGAPWGAYAWGGENEGRLPQRQRLGSTLLAPFIVAMAVILLIREEWLLPGVGHEMVWPVWAVFLFVVTQMFGAFRSQSRQEKRVMAPLYAVGAALTAIVAFGSASF
jgi:cytochrome bd-type quinol oxidase subunit 2